jgi:hypothetical protein
MRDIPDDNLAYPILIELESGSSGSGFFVRLEDRLYFVSAKHVLYNEKGNLRAKKAKLTCQSKDINDDSTYEYTVDFTILSKSGNIYPHETKDVVAFLMSTVRKEESGSYKSSTISGIDRIHVGKSPLVAVTVDSIKLIDQVFISNDVFLYGYPSSIGLKSLPQFDYLKPLLRKGIVANVNKQSGNIILDCPVYYGNSGGPVIETHQDGNIVYHKVIGVVSQFIPFVEEWKNTKSGHTQVELSNSGYSVAVAMDYVYEIIGYKSESLKDDVLIPNS